MPRGVVALAGCAAGDPLVSGSTSSSSSSSSSGSAPLVIGSHDYYSNEIVAKIYPQALDKTAPGGTSDATYTELATG